MSLAAEDLVPKHQLLRTPWAALAQSLRLLTIADGQATLGWVREAFATDAATQVQITEAVGLAAGIEQLHDQLFDAILIVHDDHRLDALELVAGLRAGGSEEPIVILGHASDDQMLALAYESGADAYLVIGTTTVRALLWTLTRAIQRHNLVRENRRLQQFERHRTEQEQREAQHLLLEQRAIVEELEALRSAGDDEDEDRLRIRARDRDLASDVPPALLSTYRELLRSYVIMGAGNLAAELERFAELLATSGLSARRTLELHLRAVEELVEGLRSRSTRHVMNRADLLILEVIVHLAERYQRRHPS